MSYEPFKVPARIANTPRPKRPGSDSPAAVWLHYYADLACWNAMRADVLRYGIVEDEKEKEKEK